VTPDVAEQTKAVNRLYTMLDPEDPALKKMNAWLNGEEESNPFQRATKIVVNVEITSAIPLSEQSWQVEWLERVTERDGTPLEELRMRAIATVYRRLPTRDTKEATLRANPMGVMIRDFSWTRLP
jgi:type IV secretion system protein VirB5